MMTTQEIRKLLQPALNNRDSIGIGNAAETLQSVIDTVNALVTELEDFGASPEAQALAKVLQMPASTPLIPAEPVTPNPLSPTPPPPVTPQVDTPPTAA